MDGFECMQKGFKVNVETDQKPVKLLQNRGEIVTYTKIQWPADGVLTFNSIFLHVLHFSNALPEVANKAGAVLLAGRHKDDENLSVPAQDGWG